MIITRLNGGMGNQMFQYAVGRSLALKSGVPLALDVTFLSNQAAIPLIRPFFVHRTYALHVFKIQASIAKKKDIPWWGRPFFSGIVMQCIDAFLRKVPIIPGWEKRFNFNPEIFALGPNAYLAGFWQSYKYFEDIADSIRSDFQLQQTLAPHAEQLKQEILSRNAVCINVRRADYTITGMHGTIDLTYFSNGLEVLREKTTVDHLYVFSDDIDWCKQNLHLDIPTTYVGREYAGTEYSEYLTLMSYCKHFIIPNSTFAWWAAWLSTSQNKIVIVPKQWFATGRLNTEDVCPSDWIRI